MKTITGSYIGDVITPTESLVEITCVLMQFVYLCFLRSWNLIKRWICNNYYTMRHFLALALYWILYVDQYGWLDTFWDLDVIIHSSLWVFIPKRNQTSTFGVLLSGKQLVSGVHLGEKWLSLLLDHRNLTTYELFNGLYTEPFSNYRAISGMLLWAHTWYYINVYVWALYAFVYLYFDIFIWSIFLFFIYAFAL